MSRNDLEKRVRAHREDILRAAREHGVERVRLAGSVARGEHDAESDVDLVVAMEEGRTLLDRGGFLIAVQDLLGCEVDVLNEDALSEDARSEILADAQTL